MLRISLKEDLSVNCGWFDWKRNFQGSQLENCRGELSLGVRKSPKLPSDATYITTSCFGGLPEKSLCCKSTTNYSAYTLPNVTGTFNGTGLCGQMRPKESCLATNIKSGFGIDRKIAIQKSTSYPL